MPPRPCIGELRHRIRVARRTRAPDPDFGFQEVMTLVARTCVVHGGRRHKVLRVREEDQTGRFIALLCAVQEIDPNDPSAPGWILTTEGGEMLVAYP
jgi:hypothetical protein